MVRTNTQLMNPRLYLPCQDLTRGQLEGGDAVFGLVQNLDWIICACLAVPHSHTGVIGAYTIIGEGGNVHGKKQGLIE